MKDMYVPDGFSVFTEPCANHDTYENMMKCGECIEKALTLSKLAYESSTADLRRHEGMERPYETVDTSEARQTINIGDGMNEALALRLSTSYIKEEDESIYSHNLHNTLKPCAWCNLMTAQPDNKCTECSDSIRHLQNWCEASNLDDETLLLKRISCQIWEHANWAESPRSKESVKKYTGSCLPSEAGRLNLEKGM